MKNSYKNFKDEILTKFKYWVECECSGLSPDDLDDSMYDSILLLFSFDLYKFYLENENEDSSDGDEDKTEVDDNVIKVNFGR